MNTNYYLLITSYGGTFLWSGRTGHEAAKSATVALGLPIAGFRPISRKDTIRRAA